MKRFVSPKKSLGALDADAAASLVAQTTDIALILDRTGIIRDVSLGSEELASEIGDSWLNRPWIETATIESRPKIETMLQDAAGSSPTRWRQINHRIERGLPDLPVTYSVVPLANSRRMMAVGRDLRALSAMQRRVVDAEQAIERDYSRLRFTEARYNVLFQLSTEAVVIVDATTQKVTEANPAAAQLFGTSTRRLIGRSIAEGFDSQSATLILEMLMSAKIAGRAPEIRVRRMRSAGELIATATLFRMPGSSYFLVQLRSPDAKSQAPELSKMRSRLFEVIESSPDGLVLTELDGRILFANRAFLDMAQLATEDLARGEPLDRWIGRPGSDVGVLLSTLRQYESVRLYPTVLRGEYGAEMNIEISAVSAPDGEQPCHGFTIRSALRHSDRDTRTTGESPRTIDELSALVGRMGLKDMVRESTDAIERMCIEAALKLAGDNRASAAEILGLSRQSLYVKLRRYNLGDQPDAEPESQSD